MSSPRLFWWLACCCTLLASLSLRAEGADSQQPAGHPVRLRLEWGGGQPRIWNGVVEISTGRLEQPTSLAVEADEPGTVWNDENAIWIRRTTPRVYDGFDVGVVASESAHLVITLAAVDAKDGEHRFEIDLRTVLNAPYGVALGSAEERLVIRRAPGDALAIQVDRPHLVFRSREKFAATIVPQIGPVSRRDGKLSWTVRPARSSQVIADGSRKIESHRGNVWDQVPFELVLPATEGVYDIEFEFTQRRLPDIKSSVQVVVVSESPFRSEIENTPADVRVDAFDPRTAGHSRKIEGDKRGKIGTSTWNRWLEGPAESNGASSSNAAGDRVTWKAFQLRLRHVERQHRLVVTLPADQRRYIGVSVLQPNAAGQLMPVGTDSAVQIEPTIAINTASHASGPPTVQHEIVFWSKVDNPVLLLHNFGENSVVDAHFVEVFEVSPKPTAPATEPSAVGATQRLVGPYLQKPLLVENFGSSEVFDASGRRSLDDWWTFYTATSRLTAYLRESGYNSLLLAAYADGSTIYPSRLLQPTPRYDTGIYFSTGQDLVRKDVLELAFRMFDREGLTLIPELQFSTPLPDLERQLTKDGERANGIELVGSDGRTWRQARGTQRGMAPYYNPLDPRVQKSVVDVVQEIVGRYASHQSLRGISIELNNSSYLHYPGIEWGYDDVTVARFAQESGVTLPAGTDGDRFAQRYEFLNGPARSKWTTWRCQQIAVFHRRLSEIVTQAKPDAVLVLSGGQLLQSESEMQNPLNGSNGARGLDSVLLEKGLDFNLYREWNSIIALRPTVTASHHFSLDSAVTESTQRQAQLDAAFSAPRHGHLFFRAPHECRISDFDSASPWQPAFTWVVASVSQSGETARRRYAHALAAGDAQYYFDGGTLIPLAEEKSTRHLRNVIQALPAVPFISQPAPQPLIVRSARLGDKTYLYAVNPISGPVDAVFHLSCAPGTTAEELSAGGMKRLENDLKTLPVSIGAYDVWMCLIHDSALRIESIEARLAASTLLAIRQQIERLDEEIRRARDPIQPAEQLLPNPGFEGTGDDTAQLAGWTTGNNNGSACAFDQENPRSGSSSLLLVSTNNGANLSSTIDLQGTRWLEFGIWLRSAAAKQPVRMTFEAKSGSQTYRQFVDVAVDQKWRRFPFQVIDIPNGRLEDATIRIELMGAGQLWIDDAQLEMRAATTEDVKQLTKTYSAVSLAWDNGRIADCERLLDSYWGRFLFGGATPASAINATQTAGGEPATRQK